MIGASLYAVPLKMYFVNSIRLYKLHLLERTIFNYFKN